MLVCRLVHSCGPDWNISTNAIKSCADINGPQMTIPTDFGDPLTFTLAPPQFDTCGLSLHCHYEHIIMMMRALSSKECCAKVQPHKAISMHVDS